MPAETKPDPWPELTADLYGLERMAAEIRDYTGQPEADVWRRLALELASTGANVIAETKRFGVTPHVFDDAMARFYNESDGFIYETMVESRSPFRMQKWRQIVDFLAADSVVPPGQTSVLLYGDSVGSDSICLKRLGYDVVYHDFDSYCAGFARARFASRGLVIPNFSGAPDRTFDYVICLEVAEHVPNPPAFVGELRRYVKDPDGVCLFSESHVLVLPQFPTHLRDNVQYHGRNDELFAAAGMVRLWRDPNDKPFAYALNPTRTHHDPFPPPSLLRRVRSRVRRALS